MSRFEQQLQLWRAGVRNTPIRSSIDCYRVVYRVRDAEGVAHIASALLALPRGAQAHTLISYQHGTTANRENVPSTLKVASREAIIVLAGAGYAVVAPDYLGLGVSQTNHPYLIAEPQARAVVAAIEAVRQIPGVPNGPVFLTGHSEGGHASLAAMRMLEASGEDVLGAAPIAGAFDLRGVSLDVALQGRAPTDVFYMAYSSWAYAHYYGQPLDSVLTPDSARVVEAMFAPADGAQSEDGLPDHPRAMFNAVFLQAYEANGRHWFLDALAQNGVSDWTPRAPVLLYYGSADTEVSPQESKTAAAHFQSRGADAEAVNLGPLEHDPSLDAALPLILTWLHELGAREDAH
jgi:pimeloyl-ACP methyl ester carboxylesterase